MKQLSPSAVGTKKKQKKEKGRGKGVAAWLHGESGFAAIKGDPGTGVVVANRKLLRNSHPLLLRQPLETTVDRFRLVFTRGYLVEKDKFETLSFAKLFSPLVLPPSSGMIKDFKAGTWTVATFFAILDWVNSVFIYLHSSSVFDWIPWMYSFLF